jgi:hypothetical protein
MSWSFRRLVGCGRESAHRGVLGRADIPDIDPPSILRCLIPSRSGHHADMEPTIYAVAASGSAD